MASQPPASQPPPPLTSSPYPYAAAPDIIRAHQKDVYFQGVLTNQLSDLHRRLRGARSAHSWATETRTFADALYLCLTTLIGNRTLGEEYCDLVQVEAPPEPSSPPSFFEPTTPAVTTLSPEDTPGGPLLPTIQRRAGYIATSILAPYLVSRILPKFRSAARKRLQSRLASLTRQGKDETGKSGQLSTEYRLLRYLLAHLPTLTNTAHIHAVTLAVFYFTGAYYNLSKCIFGLRYVFTRRIDESQPSGGRAGYEVLGVLLVVQMVVRSYLHLRQQLSSSPHPSLSASAEDDEAEEEEYLAERDRAGTAFSEVNVSLDDNAYAANNELLSGNGAPSNQRSLTEIGKTVHTPVLKNGRARYDLGLSTKMMGWIKGSQQRKCTLCLEEMKDPAATSCGHVFCWSCIGDWVREKPECPLCRREALVQHILPLRVA